MRVQQVIDDGIGGVFEAIPHSVEARVHVAPDRARVNQEDARKRHDADDRGDDDNPAHVDLPYEL
jgi:hypothetical protein